MLQKVCKRIPAIQVFFFLKISKSLRNNGKKLGQIVLQIWLFFKFYCSVTSVISKERNTVRASNPRASLTWTDNTSKVGYVYSCSKPYTNTAMFVPTSCSLFTLSGNVYQLLLCQSDFRKSTIQNEWYCVKVWLQNEWYCVQVSRICSIISIGSKYRFPTHIDFKKCREAIAGGFNYYCTRWCKREHVESNALNNWKLNIFQIIDKRISCYSNNPDLHLPPPPPPTHTH